MSLCGQHRCCAAASVSREHVEAHVPLSELRWPYLMVASCKCHAGGSCDLSRMRHVAERAWFGGSSMGLGPVHWPWSTNLGLVRRLKGVGSRVHSAWLTACRRQRASRLQLWDAGRHTQRSTTPSPVGYRRHRVCCPCPGRTCMVVSFNLLLQRTASPPAERRR